VLLNAISSVRFMVHYSVSRLVALFCSLSEADARHSQLADSVLLMMNFGIDKMSLEIQSRGMYLLFVKCCNLILYVLKLFYTDITTEHFVGRVCLHA